MNFRFKETNRIKREAEKKKKKKKEKKKEKKYEEEIIKHEKKNKIKINKRYMRGCQKYRTIWAKGNWQHLEHFLTTFPMMFYTRKIEIRVWDPTLLIASSKIPYFLMQNGCICTVGACN